MTVAFWPGTVQLLLVRATGSMTLTRVIGVWFPNSGTSVVAVILRPCESRAITWVDSWVMVLPLTSVWTRVILNSAV